MKITIQFFIALCPFVHVAYSFSQSTWNEATSFKSKKIQHINTFRIHNRNNEQSINAHDSRLPTQLYSTAPTDDDIQNQLAKARKLLEETKAKVAASEQAKEQNSETQLNSNDTENDDEETTTTKRESVIKSTNEETGLITTDGELMAALSEEEEWEVKSLMDVFESESENGRHDVIDDGLASRDVAASIFNLRLKMQEGDYKRIFDKRNRFIGEDN